MNIVKPIFVFSLFFFFGLYALQSQNEMKTLSDRGDSLLALQQYEKALDAYKQALTLSPASPKLNYQIALTYYSLNDYNVANHYTNIGIRQAENEFSPLFYELQATIFLETDRTLQAIECAKAGLKKYPKDIPLTFCLGLAYSHMEKYQKAQEYALEILSVQPQHKGSHLILGYSAESLSNNVQAAMSFYFFLMLEPDSERSAPVFEKLLQNLGISPINEEDKKEKFINPKDQLFKKTAEMLPVFFAQTQTDLEKKQNEFFQFKTVSELFFKYLKMDDIAKKEDFWRTFYVPFFFEITRQNLTETFCHYIRYQAYMSSFQWVNEHKKEVNAMADFLNQQFEKLQQN